MKHPIHPRRHFLAVFSMLAMLGGVPETRADAADSGNPITRAKDVRSLRAGQLQPGPPVRLRGIVLRRWLPSANFILQDKSDVIFVDLLKHDVINQPGETPLGIKVGSVVEVAGTATVGDFAPIVIVSKRADLQVVGTAPLPAPVPLTAETALAGQLDGHLVTAEGVARRTRFDPRFQGAQVLEMVFEGTRLFVLPYQSDYDLDALVDARIRITGISSGIWNKQGQITAPCLLTGDSPTDITVLRAAPADPFALPTRSVADIMRYRPEDTPGHRIHIAGVVLHALPDGRVFVFDGERAVCVDTTEMPIVAIGERVDAAGFPGMRERSPLLEDAVLRVRGHADPLPPPVPREVATLLEQSEDYELARMAAVLLETQRTSHGTDLLLQSGDQVFKAAFAGPGPPGFLATLKPGTRLSLDGLVLLSFPSPTDQNFRPNGFSILLRSPADVRIIRQPPWWTVARLLKMLGTALALVLAFALWNLFLQSRAKNQQEIISAQTRREATSEERARLARELHDTLEQEFVGMTRQTEALEHAGPLAPQARENLDVLRQMLALSRDNARRTVWDLRDPALLDVGLEAAIRAALQRIVSGKPMTLDIHAEMDPAADIPPQVQVNVLRLAQEAVTNAVKHSDARNITIRLRHHDGMLSLTVADDGHGEQDSSPSMVSAGHFGIIGMKERCEKLGGRFDFHSRPDSGTSVQAQIPV